MFPLPTDKIFKDALHFKKPKGIILDGNHWLFLKERFHMTTRELQVAILVCRGFNNNEIAKALKIKEGTVKTHLRNLYRRTQVVNKILLLLKFVDEINECYVSKKPGDEFPFSISEIPPKRAIPEQTQKKQ
jgi:DNA-binding CsgD family transcriptional regulator